MGEKYVAPQKHFLLIHFSLSSDLQVSSWLFTTPRSPVDFKERGSVGAVWKSPNKGFQEEAAKLINTRIYIGLKDANRFSVAMTSCVNGSGPLPWRGTVEQGPHVCSDNSSQSWAGYIHCILCLHLLLSQEWRSSHEQYLMRDCKVCKLTAPLHNDTRSHHL